MNNNASYDDLRCRNPKFADEEKEILVASVIKYRTLLQWPAADAALRARLKQSQWRLITEDVNRVNRHFARAEKEVQKKWQNETNQARRDFQAALDANAAHNVTQYTRRILDVVNNSHGDEQQLVRLFGERLDLDGELHVLKQRLNVADTPPADASPQVKSEPRSAVEEQQPQFYAIEPPQQIDACAPQRRSPSPVVVLAASSDAAQTKQSSSHAPSAYYYSAKRRRLVHATASVGGDFGICGRV